MNNRSKTSSLYFREQIQAAMREIFDYPLTIVEAPMGYGKTTAVREHLKDSGANELWTQIHDDLTRGFWNGLCDQLEGIDRNVARSLFELGFPDDSVSMQEALKLIKKIKLPEKTVLIIDDYHLISKESVNRFIKFLTVSEIKNLNIVLIARFVELSSIEELSLKGYLHYISKEIFELTATEIKKYYRLCGVNLKDSDAEKLYVFTEGWISALYLFMLNYVKHGSFQATRDIYKLVGNTVYLNFSDEIKEFLQNVCFFDSFTLEQAAEISQNQDAEKLLSEIIGKNAFVKYDDKTSTYQIHNIFSQYLQGLTQSKDAAYKTQLYHRTAKFYMKSKEYIKAMKYFYLAHDFENLLNVVEADKGHSIHNEQREIFIKYFEECPAPIRQHHPIVMLIYAICLFSFNEMERFAQVCEEFAETVRQQSSLKAEMLRDTMGEFELLLSFTKYNHIQEMYEHIKNAERMLSRPAKFLDTKSSWTFGAPSVLYMFYREPGTLKQEVNNLKEAIPIYQKLTNGHGIGGEYIMEAEWQFSHGDFDSAEIALNKAFYSANQNRQGDIVICTMFLQARIAIAKGEYTNAVGILRKMREEVSRKRLYSLVHTIDLCDAFLYAELKMNEKIPLWIREGQVDSSKLYFPTRSFYNIVYGRVLLINGEYLKLLGLAEGFAGEASVFPNLLSLIYINIYIAAANKKIHRHDDAMAALRNALDDASADRVYMPFVENCDYIKPLLEKIYRQGDYKVDITAILELEKSYRLAVDQMKNENSPQNKTALTQREMEIAQLAAQGLTNKEIGERLFVTENTVKMALKNIYGKLCINSRVLLKQYFE